MKSCGNKEFSSFKEGCVDSLRKAGCRVTKQRLAVIDCIEEAQQPLSAPEIFEKLSQSSRGAPLDKVSVYRVLETLLELGLVHRVGPNGGYFGCEHQECAHSHHVLSRCVRCQEVREVDIPQELVEPLLVHMSKKCSFTPDSHLLHMDGICAQCA